jgi:hypothetical protein
MFYTMPPNCIGFCFHYTEEQIIFTAATGAPRRADGDNEQAEHGGEALQGKRGHEKLDLVTARGHISVALDIDAGIGESRLTGAATYQFHDVSEIVR